MIRRYLSAFIVAAALSAPVVTTSLPKAVVVDIAPDVMPFTEAAQSTNLLPFELSAVRLRRPGQSNRSGRG